MPVVILVRVDSSVTIWDLVVPRVLVLVDSLVNSASKWLLS